ncbi:MAG: hypothetical protein U9R74_08285 [Pseudomonadota bacterium]|nr:hypothetical protein [Pseudomonadota bacterium]
MTTTLGLQSMERTVTIPGTLRGKALLTTDWYLHGRPVLRNHDTAGLATLKARSMTYEDDWPEDDFRPR